MNWIDFAIRMFAAPLLGGAIGLERQWRQRQRQPGADRPFAARESGWHMQRRFRTWLGSAGSAWPTAYSPYWRALPVGRMKMLLAGTFFIASAMGFAFDLMQLNSPPVGRGLFWPVLAGAAATALLLAVIKRMRLIPLLYVLVVAIGWLGYRASHASTRLLVPDALSRRVLFDAIGICLGIAVGSRLLTLFAGTEGVVSMRMETELALAHAIQATLVPTLALRTTNFDIYGKSIPSASMGGDLIDVIESDGNLLVYVADISGHGLAAGQLMGMLKTAIRVAVQFRQAPVATLESADRVLPALKDPQMFATLALLHFDGSEQAEYALAGHVPIVHYRHRTRDTAQLSMEQLPLALIPGGTYTTGSIRYSAGDLFLMVTDGTTEVVNERDEEFGLTRLEQVLTQHATRPLPEIWDFIMGAVRSHGVPQDDQSLLLLRVLDTE